MKHDPEVVCTACLAELLDIDGRMEQHQRERRRGTWFSTLDPAPVLETLAWASGVPTRRIRGIANLETCVTAYRIAERLLCRALDRPDLILQLDVYRNPVARSVGIAGGHVCSRREFAGLYEMKLVAAGDSSNAPGRSSLTASPRSADDGATEARGVTSTERTAA